MKHVIIGVDPGTTTGLAVYSIEDQSFFMTLEFDEPKTAVSSILGLIDLLCNNSHHVKITSERVDINPNELRGKTQAGIRDALRVADTLWFLAQVYNVDHTEILRASSKCFASDQQLRARQWYNSSRHIRDAMRVVITYLADHDQDFLKIWAN